jgi:hypothetical protein
MFRQLLLRQLLTLLFEFFYYQLVFSRLVYVLFRILLKSSRFYIHLSILYLVANRTYILVFTRTIYFYPIMDALFLLFFFFLLCFIESRTSMSARYALCISRQRRLLSPITCVLPFVWSYLLHSRSVMNIVLLYTFSEHLYGSS